MRIEEFSQDAFGFGFVVGYSEDVCVIRRVSGVVVHFYQLGGHPAPIVEGRHGRL
jgi:hypothetical protein